MNEARSHSEGIRFERKGSGAGAVDWGRGGEGEQRRPRVFDVRAREAPVRRAHAISSRIEEPVRQVPARAAQPVEPIDPANWRDRGMNTERAGTVMTETVLRARDRLRGPAARRVATDRPTAIAMSAADIFKSARGGATDISSTRFEVSWRLGRRREKADLRDQQKLSERAGATAESKAIPGLQGLARPDRSPELAQQWRYRERRPAIDRRPHVSSGRRRTTSARSSRWSMEGSSTTVWPASAARPPLRTEAK